MILKVNHKHLISVFEFSILFDLDSGIVIVIAFDAVGLSESLLVRIDLDDLLLIVFKSDLISFHLCLDLVHLTLELFIFLVFLIDEFRESLVIALETLVLVELDFILRVFLLKSQDLIVSLSEHLEFSFVVLGDHSKFVLVLIDH